MQNGNIVGAGESGQMDGLLQGHQSQSTEAQRWGGHCSAGILQTQRSGELRGGATPCSRDQILPCESFNKYQERPFLTFFSLCSPY